jgi:hypothetical protein
MSLHSNLAFRYLQCTLLGNEQWIGLEKIYNLTNRPTTPMKLHIRMEDFSGTVKDAYYDTFRVENEVPLSILFVYARNL